MPNHIVNIGNVELISLNDNLPLRSPFVAFPHTTIEQWNEYPELMADHENGKHRWGALAIRSSGRLIVVDTGMQGEGCYLLEDMEKKGIDRDEVETTSAGTSLTVNPIFPTPGSWYPRKTGTTGPVQMSSTP